MLFGLPGSTDEDFSQTIGFLAEAGDAIDAMTQSSLILFKNTPFSSESVKYGLEVLGEDEFCRIGGRRIGFSRLSYRERQPDGFTKPPRGPLEVALLEDKKRWFRRETIYERLWVEHYLLYASLQAEIKKKLSGDDPDGGKEDRAA